MKKVIVLVVLSVIVLSSCSRSITPWQAANGKAKCGRWLR
jgi:uncharacterized lipoprotein